MRGDCANCFGLCCTALPFAASADFAADKPAGQPCGNLQADFRCGIHARLRERGYSGCTVFDCFGAGQRVSQETFGGRSWRADPGSAQPMFAAFPVVQRLHELLWYLTEALSLPEAESLHPQVRAELARIDGLAGGTPEELARVDLAAERAQVNPLLLRASELARADAPVRGKRRDRRGADLLGANLKGADLRGVDLRGALLIAADLRGADLRRADLIGADLRDAKVAGADFTGALFLTQPQVNAAKGDAATHLPAGLERPGHW
ncbi:pentapeptide repeat-containing protein [Streptomonospora sp. S1-112]|uniref:Pentapeptide repeat-containing protein n=1 Tax=Streptomonospora mangrovi TaxID=2883123 RepID=A0A9X3NJT4_9ACTN|nr:pentapeptide repeat-containing protein [Streptomonospora mangrovi]MDA0564797.1 pentapeptide repeat-containing protein [Streptomonospora mangrovi]